MIPRPVLVRDAHAEFQARTIRLELFLPSGVHRFPSTLPPKRCQHGAGRPAGRLLDCWPRIEPACVVRISRRRARIAARKFNIGPRARELPPVFRGEASPHFLASTRFRANPFFYLFGAVPNQLRVPASSSISTTFVLPPIASWLMPTGSGRLPAAELKLKLSQQQTITVQKIRAKDWAPRAPGRSEWLVDADGFTDPKCPALGWKLIYEPHAGMSCRGKSGIHTGLRLALARANRTVNPFSLYWTYRRG